MNKPRIESYAEIPLFQGLDKDEIDTIIGLTKPRRFEKGEVIFSEGDTSNSLYLVEEGSVVVKKHFNRSDEVIAHLQAKTIFGEMALTTDEPRAATVIATTEVTAGEVLCEDFTRLLDVNSSAACKLSLNIARVLTSRINHMLDQLDTLSSNRHADEDATELAAFRQQVFSEWSF